MLQMTKVLLDARFFSMKNKMMDCKDTRVTWTDSKLMGFLTTQRKSHIVDGKFSNY
jgi:hypothetical protein